MARFVPWLRDRLTVVLDGILALGLTREGRRELSVLVTAAGSPPAAIVALELAGLLGALTCLLRTICSGL